MIHYLKNGLILSNWVQIGNRENWIKHRIDNYDKTKDNKQTQEQIRLLRMAPMMRGGAYTYYLSFVGEGLKYIEDSYHIMYGSEPIMEQDLEEVKQQIDTFLNKIDKLLPFI